MRVYFAQNKEDLFIKSFFPDIKKGFYIDVGANDPVLDSVTKLLYDEGWSGINVDPITRHINNLRQQRKRDTNIHAGLGDKPGTLKFREYYEGDGLSTFDNEMKEQYEKDSKGFPTAKYSDYEVPIKTLAQVIDEENVKHIHFIKIDVEGYEFEVISGYDWTDIRPELICIEANHIIGKDWRPLLKKRDYELVFFDGINNYYLAKESLYRKDYFNYPDTVFAGNPVYQPAVIEIEKNFEQRKADKEQELIKRIRDKEEHIDYLNRQQRDVRFLAKRLISEIQTRLNKRAKYVQREPGLSYASDDEIAARVESKEGNTSELVEFIQQRDAQNIRKTRSKNSVFSTFFWKFCAKSFNFMARVARKFVKAI